MLRSILLSLALTLGLFGCQGEIAYAQGDAVSAPACPQCVDGVAPTATGQIVVTYTGFTVGYIPSWGEPAWSAQHETADSVKAGEAVKRNGEFHKCAELPPEDQISPDVYAKSGYDLGHMTEAGSRGVDKSETFGTCNMVPQKPNLNRKIWAHGELALRSLAASGQEIYIVTGPEVTQNPTMLQGKVAVPTKTWKAVYVVGKGAEAWICTNTDAPVCSEETIQALFAEIGFDPFPTLPYAVKTTPYVIPMPIS